MECDKSTLVDNSKNELLSSSELGAYKLKNRVIMCSMTRLRADAGGIPNDIMAKYYSERAEDAGLVLTECSAVSKDGDNLPLNGGAYTKEQMAGWKKVVDGVHKVGGKIFCQIFHCGRCTVSDPIGPSPITNRYGGKYETPREMTTDDIKNAVKQFITSAKLLKEEAGFDGVEILAGNGYLIDQFLRDCSNHRTDEYGGSIENRSKFLLEVLDGVIEVFGANKVGIKLSPVSRYNDMFDSKPKELLGYILPQINSRKIAFAEICQADLTNDDLYNVNGKDQIEDMWTECKKYLTNVNLVANYGLDYETASRLINEGKADFVSFGQMYISNPDLVDRLKNNYLLTPPDFTYVYDGVEKGYIDYKKHSK